MEHWVVIRDPEGRSRRVSLRGERLSVGRSHENDLSYPGDPSLSRLHLVLEPERDGWAVRDLDSKNHTFLNGQRVAGREKLRPGDRVVAGQITMIYDDSGGDASDEVVFYPGSAEEAKSEGTVLRHLDGLLARAATPAEPIRPLLETPSPDAVDPLDHPAVRALVTAGMELSVRRPLPELYRIILDLAIGAVEAERGVLMTLERGELVVQEVRGQGFRISTTVRDRVLRERASILVRDVSLDDEFRSRVSVAGQDIRTMLAVPLQTRRRVTGLIHVDSRSRVRRFTPGDLEFLTVLANVAATRIEEERLRNEEAAKQLLARELEQAAEIQRQLLPLEAPKVPGIDVAGFNAPCRTVGGDYYEFLPASGRGIAVVLGDVAGKGLAAALLMAALQARVQVLAEDPSDLAGFMSRLDRSIAGRIPISRFVSLFICVIDPVRQELAYCNAGHNPPLLVTAAGAVERLEACGTVLGMLPELGYEERRCRLEPGSVVTLFSDGVIEATASDGEEFGEERLSRILVRHRGREATEILDEVRTALGEWTAGEPQGDDITVVVARVNGPGA